MGARAQKKKERFVGFAWNIAHSPQIDLLEPIEFKLLFQLYRQYNGKNNGDLSCTWSVMAKHGWRSPTTLNKARYGLIEKGWIEETRKGYTGRCSLYAVTWLAIDECKSKLDCLPTRVPSMLFREKNRNPSTESV